MDQLVTLDSLSPFRHLRSISQSLHLFSQEDGDTGEEIEEDADENKDG